MMAEPLVVGWTERDRGALANAGSAGLDDRVRVDRLGVADGPPGPYNVTRPSSASTRRSIHVGSRGRSRTVSPPLRKPA